MTFRPTGTRFSVFSARAAILATSALVSVVSLTGEVRADTLTWTGAVDNGWNGVALNWDNGGSADSFDAGDDVIFDGTSTPGVIDMINTAPNSVQFDAAGFTIDGNAGMFGTADNGNSIEFIVNEDATINTNLGGGVAVTINGNNPGGSNVLTFNGIGNQITTATIDNTVGLVNNGTFGSSSSSVITNFGDLTSTGTIGQLTSTGANASATLSGNAQGNLTINGGTFDLGGNLVVEDDTYIRVDLTVENGETLTTDTFTGAHTSSTTIEGGGEIAGDVNISGDASLALNNNGTITGDLTVSTSVPNGANISGNVTGNVVLLSGSATLGATSNIDGELDNNATLSVAAGASIGSVDNDGTFSIFGTPATINIDGTGGFNNGPSAVLQNSTVGAVTLDLGSETFVQNATATINGTVNAGGSLIINAGTFDHNGGALNGTIAINADVDNSATLTLGGTSTVTVTGDITNESTGVLNVETGGTAEGVTNSGDVNISGGTVASVTNTTGTVDLTGGQITGTTEINGGIVTNTSGTMTGQTTVNDGFFNTASDDTGAIQANTDGTVNVSGGATGAITNDGGDVNITGGDVASLDNNSGTTDLSTGGEVEGDTTVDGGTVTNLSGTLAGVTVTDDGVLVTNSATGDVTNDGTTGGTNNVSITGGTVDSLDNNSGETVLTGGAVTGVTTVDGGTVTNTSGTLNAVTVTDTGVLSTAGTTGAVTNDGTTDGTNNVEITGGTVESLANNSGDAELTGGEITGTVQVDGGEVTNTSGQISGLTTVTDGTFNTSATTAAISSQGGITNVDGGTTGGITNNGGIVNANTGSIDSLDNDGGTVNLDGATVSLNGSNADIWNFDGGTVSGDFFNTDGTATVESASGVSGTFNNSAAVEVDANLTFGDFVNTGTVNVNSGEIGGGNVLNDGTFSFADGTSYTGGIFTNNSSTTLIVDGGVSLAALDNTSTGTINMQDGDQTDVLTVTGDATLNGTIAIDVDLDAGTADTINVGGALSGTGEFDVSDVGADGVVDIPLLTYGSGGGSFGLADGSLPPGAFIYGIEDTGSSWNLVSSTAGGTLASGVVLTQALIGSVVNRPSSPYIAGPLVQEEDPCGPGIWARTTGGTADVDGASTGIDADGNETFDLPGSVSADYYGIQLGGDFSCFQGHYNGWSLSFGGILGVNQGSTSQLVDTFEIQDGVAVLSGDPLSRNDTDFTQTYAGAYVGAVKDRFFGDLQYRVEETEFEIENFEIQAGQGLGLNTSFNTSAQTLSGTAGYVFPLNEEQGVSLVALGGFAFTQTDGTSVEFDDGSVLVIDDSESQIGFLSATVSRAQVQPDNVSVLTYFGTATVYSDFASKTRSEYFQFPLDINGDPEVGGELPTEGDVSESSNLGTYGELSIGLNYSRLLEPGDVGSAKQFDASVRLDGRFSEDIESYGLTAQARLQF